MKVIFNKNRCQGTGICDSICCEVCDRNLEESEFAAAILTEEYKSACKKAAKFCPSGAISIVQ